MSDDNPTRMQWGGPVKSRNPDFAILRIWKPARLLEHAANICLAADAALLFTAFVFGEMTCHRMLPGVAR